MCNDLDLKFDQNLMKLYFYIIFISFCIIMIEISFKNGSKRFKLIKNNLITLCTKNVFMMSKFH